MAGPLRGEVWNAHLDPIRGHEQAGRRPVLVISADGFNGGPADLAVVLPITSKRKGIPWHVPVKAGDAGLRRESYIMCEMIRSVSWDRLSKRLGQVSDSIIREVETRLTILLQM